MGERTGRPALWLFLHTLLMLGLVGAAVILFEPLPGRDKAVTTLLLFLGVLPLMNGLADFLSLGATRYTLRMGVSTGRRVWVWMLADLALGAAIFVGLGCGLIAYVDWVRLPDGSALIDVPALLRDIRASLSDGAEAEGAGTYWWLYLMVFSTLIPTALHLVVASFGSVLKLSGWLRRHIADGLAAGGAGDRVAGRWAVQWLCLSMTLTVMVPVMVLGTLWTNGAAIGLGVLDVFDAFAGWIAG